MTDWSFREARAAAIMRHRGRVDMALMAVVGSVAANRKEGETSHE